MATGAAETGTGTQGQPARTGRIKRALALPWHLIFVAYAVVVLTIPTIPIYPSADTDGSYFVAINRAVAQGLVFGRDIVYTYGPYGSVWTSAYDPGVRWLPILGGVLLAIGFGTATIWLLKDRPVWLALTLGVAVLIGEGNTDATGLVFPLLALVVMVEMPSGSLRPRIEHRLVLAALAAGLGLLPLIKLSFVLSALICILFGASLLALRKWWLEAILVLAVSAASMVLMWLLAGQPVGALVDYFRWFLPISTGYSDAMSAGDHFSGTELVLLALVAVVISITPLLARSPWPERLLLAAMLGATFLLAGKAALVREHLLIPGVVLIVASLVAARNARRVWVPIVLVALAVVTSLSIDHSINRQSDMLRELRINVVDTAHLAMLRVFKPKVLDQQYVQALRQVRREQPLPRTKGKVDLYTKDTTRVFASGLDWDPRPVFQSYQAYSPALADLNLAHLTGESSPDAVLFQLWTIDGRLPMLDDGPSILPLLERYQYQPHPQRPSYLELKRRSAPLDLKRPDVIDPFNARMDEWVPIPDSGGGWLADIDIQPSVAGKLVSLLNRLPLLTVTVETVDRETRDFRYIAAMGRAGFVLSPLVASTQDMAALFSPGQEPPPAVRRIRFSVEGNDRLWQQRFTVRLTAFDLIQSNARP